MNDIFYQVKQRIPFDIRFGVQTLVDLPADKTNIFSKRELQEFCDMQNVRRKQEFVTSRILLQQLAKAITPQSSGINILKNELGKPFGKSNRRHYYLSIAHSGNKVFCGITLKQAVGIDLEPVNRNVSPGLEKRIAHPAEQNLLIDLPVIQIWTLKEAYIKLCGQGLRLNMNEVKVEMEDGYFLVKSHQKDARIESFSADGHWFSIAYYS